MGCGNVTINSRDKTRLGKLGINLRMHRAHETAAH